MHLVVGIYFVLFIHILFFSKGVLWHDSWALTNPQCTNSLIIIISSIIIIIWLIFPPLPLCTVNINISNISSGAKQGSTIQ